ncbi:MAG: DUF1036 domain-containing protein [Pseudorhodoplanes sp.]|nr:DUF1036 domain-containing protein [Pseudorhodoplanes sp.]
MANAILARCFFIPAVFAGLLASAAPAAADLKLCNRTSYVADAAIAMEERGAAASRGWFRVVPGQCRPILQGQPPAEAIFVHARTPALYGTAPLAPAGDNEFCIADADFVIGGARKCRSGQRFAKFNAVKPTAVDQDFVIYLAEEAEYSDLQARDAGIQRLLIAAGYDATPIDGIRGAKTEAALAQFIQDNKLSLTAAGRSDFFDILLDAAQKPGSGFSWCNDTVHTVMAAIGMEDTGVLITRGWYRIEPGKCLRPDIVGQPRRVYSFAEAVDSEGRRVTRSDGPLVWGGADILCTRNTRFEIADQTDCAAKGLTASGFAAVDLADRRAMTIRFK